MTNLLTEMREYAAKHHVPIIRENETKILLAAVSQCKPKRILEIGTAIGYSALLMLSAAEASAQLTTLELSAERAAVARGFWQKSAQQDKIELIEGDAGTILPHLQYKYDFVFIDAAKGQYIDYWYKIQSLLLPQAIVVTDNVLFRGYLEDNAIVPRRFRTITKRLKEYIHIIEHDSNYDTHIYRDGDGLAVTRRLY